MSASLVGSEMCIRDSTLTSQRGPAPQSPSTACPGDNGDRTIRGEGIAPVSYTHLTLPTICSV
eukprot:7735700-Alexandrium_andersonii.AAC.1